MRLVRLHGFHAEMQSLRDLAGTLTFANQTENFEFTIGEIRD
jgi:hypothetical protein